jgi:hypothetical protein
MPFVKGDPNINRKGRTTGALTQLKEAVGGIENITKRLREDFENDPKFRLFVYEHVFGKPPQVNINENENLNIDAKDVFQFELVNANTNNSKTVAVPSEQKTDGDIQSGDKVG